MKSVDWIFGSFIYYIKESILINRNINIYCDIIIIIYKIINILIKLLSSLSSDLPNKLILYFLF